MNLLSNTVTLTLDSEFIQLSKLYDKIASSVDLPYFNWNQETALEEIRKAENLVVAIDGSIRSFITYRNYPDRFEISALGSDPDYLKMGYAQHLLETLKKCATAQKKPVWLEVHAENLKALKLYQSNGFSAVQRRKTYYSDQGDAVVMTWTDGSA